MTRTIRASAPFVLAAVLLLATALPARAAAGDPDTTFGGTGSVRTEVSGGFDLGLGVVVQPNGRIVVVGQATTGPTFDDADFGVTRYLLGGDPDTSFSGDGIQSTDFSGQGDVADAVTLQADGKIVAAGSSSVAGGSPRFAVVRYKTGGALDTTFSGDGKVRTPFVGYDEASASDVAVGSGGKIVVVGSVTSGTHRGGPGVETDIGVARYKAGGALDGTFGGGDGRVTTDFGGNTDIGEHVALLDSGEILVAGLSQTDSGEQRVVVAKYHANGILDTGFDGDGRVVVNMSPGNSESSAGIAVRTDGKIVVGASVRNGASSSSDADIGVLLLNANGSIATSFGGGDGMAFADYGGVEDPDAMVRDTTGKLFFVASRPFVSAENPQAILVFRLTSAGAKDLAYGASGKATIEDPNGIGGFALAVDASHRAVPAGRVGIGNEADFAVARLQA